MGNVRFLDQSDNDFDQSIIFQFGRKESLLKLGADYF